MNPLNFYFNSFSSTVMYHTNEDNDQYNSEYALAISGHNYGSALQCDVFDIASYAMYPTSEILTSKLRWDQKWNSRLR